MADTHSNSLAAAAAAAAARRGVQTELNNRLLPRGIKVEHVMLRGVKLPDQLQQAIQVTTAWKMWL